MTTSAYPPVLDEDLIGFFNAEVCAGGGYVWDAVLEYRVWIHPASGDGDDCFQPFATYEEAFEFHQSTEGAEEPLALILQREYIDEDEPGRFEHIIEPRLTEWPVEFLSRPARTANTIPNFFAPDAPQNRIEILRGTAE